MVFVFCRFYKLLLFHNFSLLFCVFLVLSQCKFGKGGCKNQIKFRTEVNEFLSQILARLTIFFVKSYMSQKIVTDTA